MQPPRLAFVLIAAVLFALPRSAQPSDTKALAANLATVRCAYQIPAPKLVQLQQQFLNWVDARIQLGRTVEAIGAELSENGLIEGPSDHCDPNEYPNSTGFVQLRDLPVADGGGLFALEAGIGVTCGVYPTAVVYQQYPLSRLAWFGPNTDRTESPWTYRKIAIGKADSQGRRPLAALAERTWCSSSFTQVDYFLGIIRGSSVRVLLHKTEGARYSESTSATIVGDRVTFTYDKQLRDTQMFSRSAIESYRLRGDRLERVAPLASSIFGFIDEWVQMNDREAARWSSPEAARAHRQVSRWKTSTLDFEAVSSRKCAGSPRIWEVGVKIDRVVTFTISENGVSRMRMESVRDGAPARNCQVLNFGENGWEIDR